MELRGCVDGITQTDIWGWAADPADLRKQIAVDIYINGGWVGRVNGMLFREDLKAAGLGDGRKSFHFDPSHYLLPGPNRIRVVFADTDSIVSAGEGELFCTRVIPGALDSDPSARGRLLTLSQERWKGTESDAHLTWGSMLSGDSFIEAVQAHHIFGVGDHICEVGPGYGRLLKTILERQLPFQRYTGIELSEERCGRLHQEFSDTRITFIQGDVTTVHPKMPVDLVVCSATFEHLFPDCRPALLNLAKNLRPGSVICVDFIQQDSEMCNSNQQFEPQGHAFVRVYSASELREIFRECGYVHVTLEPIILGDAGVGPIRRILVSALRK